MLEPHIPLLHPVAEITLDNNDILWVQQEYNNYPSESGALRWYYVFIIVFHFSTL
jgi:hypothetical protein